MSEQNSGGYLLGLQSIAELAKQIEKAVAEKRCIEVCTATAGPDGAKDGRWEMHIYLHPPGVAPTEEESKSFGWMRRPATKS